MANQSKGISKINKFKKHYFLKFTLQEIVIILIMLIWCSSVCIAMQWSPSVSSSLIITTDRYSFSSFSQISIRGVATGIVSKSIYYLNFVYNPSVVVFRKVGMSGSQVWMASYSIDPVLKSLSVDAQEQNIYAASSSAPFLILRLYANDGTIVSTHML